MCYLVACTWLCVLLESRFCMVFGSYWTQLGPNLPTERSFAATRGSHEELSTEGANSIHFLTPASNASTVSIVMVKGLFLTLAACALMLLQLGDCMSAITPDQESMNCCGSMPCTPANQNHDCCKAMVSGQSPNMLPAARVSLNAPAITLVEPLTSVEVVRLVSSPRSVVEAQQHSPPELYTLHASLLI